MKTKKILIIILLAHLTYLKSEDKKTVTSFFASCKDDDCCEKNLINCKTLLPEAEKICQAGLQICRSEKSLKK